MKTRKLTVSDIRDRKVREDVNPLVMVTAYDAPSARIANEAGVDLILVGDSLAMVVLGYDNTLQVSIRDMIYHTEAVARIRPDVHVVADMPWMSYHVSDEDAVKNAAALIRAGADSVKVEVRLDQLPTIERILSCDIPVIGHIGLTPQAVYASGGFKVQAKQHEEVVALIRLARKLENAGCYAVLLECVPMFVAEAVTVRVGIPTIGIGAGPYCDGQVLVYHDILGLEKRSYPRFVRNYADLHKTSTEALTSFAADVRSQAFPDHSESYDSPKWTMELQESLSQLDD